eukprot:1288032-Rhodomonas_salina.3
MPYCFSCSYCAMRGTERGSAGTTRRGSRLAAPYLRSRSLRIALPLPYALAMQYPAQRKIKRKTPQSWYKPH